MGSIPDNRIGMPLKRKCVLCKKKGYYDDFTDICKEKQGIQRFDICKECMNDLQLLFKKYKLDQHRKHD